LQTPETSIKATVRYSQREGHSHSQEENGHDRIINKGASEGERDVVAIIIRRERFRRRKGSNISFQDQALGGAPNSDHGSFDKMGRDWCSMI
jgi:ribosomal protein L14